MTSRLMQEVLTQGTAASARSLGFKLPAAGKTGTTNDYKDAWFVGYTTTLTCGVWVGFDQPTTIIPHGYGAALALPVWTQVMNKAAQHYPAEPLQPTMPLQHTTVCSISNQLATTGCRAAGTAYDIDLPVGKRAKRRLPGAWWRAMAVCTTGAEWASESAFGPGPLLQIVQAILRTLTDFAQTPSIAMGRAVPADSACAEFTVNSSARHDTGRPV